MSNISDFYELLEFHNQDTESFTCVGYAKSKGRRCWKNIGQPRIKEVKRLLGTLPGILALDGEELDDTLSKMADLSICHLHKDQREGVASRWRRALQRHDTYTPGASSSSPPSSSSIRSRPSSSQAPDANFQARDAARFQAEYEWLERRLAEAEELLRQQRSQRSRAGRPSSSGSSSRRPQTSSGDSNRRDGRDVTQSGATHQRSSPERRNGNEDDDDDEDEEEQEQRRREEKEKEEERARRDSEEQRRRRREEALRQSRREREEQEADARRRAEQTQRRQREQEARERQREQEARARAEIWESSWTRYERDWANLSRIDTANLPEDILDTLPWPVQTGRWQDATQEANIRQFFRHAPQNARPDEDPRAYVKLLFRQTKRWHTDAIARRFPRSIDDEPIKSLATVIVQVVIDEIFQTRQRMERSS